MNPHRQHVQTLVIGAGQAGLATAHELQERGVQVLVVDGNARLGDNWRCHWDSLRLFTPVRYDGLPGLPFPGDPWSYPGKDDVADYLEQYALETGLPVRLRTRVDRLTAAPDGGFLAHVGDEAIACDDVVVATGTRGRTPAVPDVARRLDPSVRQLHSSEYRSPASVSGPTLVVGTSHSGCEIAYELAAHVPVTLCGRFTGREPVRPGSRWDRIGTPLLVLVARHVLTRRTPPGRALMRRLRGPHHGLPTARITRRELAERGVTWIEERVEDVTADGRPLLADGTAVDVETVVWCTGYALDHSWIELPVLGDDGWPREYRGVAHDVPGLYFCGLVFQWSMASMVLPGVAADAAYVADHIAHRAARPVSRSLASA
ncbi:MULTISPECIES: NAD(P)/FAD-dependent oxidoreductase [unclassified Isoptericola]|uniref:flavin-containing monooxygenase n=1 Tax=unclassified Isoptericola TaxID=2623355 RepID=UPI002713E09D|nr:MULTISPECIES: NAD(P)/FAD-dependent oxidoreductase [unclassified Isoptericola]MDO8149672.1 NAD(P)/FAD-dependent oxidoreductase [Isoptericola sp. b515]MDO8152607.1 NAD(P)/FAD-dependent oxidoreductase [Isoptericola sp. b408]